MDRISVNSQIHFSKPCMVGTRITVQSVLELLDQGLSFDAIIRGRLKTPEEEVRSTDFGASDRGGGLTRKKFSQPSLLVSLCCQRVINVRGLAKFLGDNASDESHEVGFSLP
ncbi:DUF433 domain-containing protein [Brasilonema sp. UFV-L1]|uniref:DUF433 domain-containing protein n=1 Tax=Brasilonema sp. UFV-L1 TaxID=2234130 RepID=UPI00145D249F|nr:DUF433 domain-containing protein [Brasilonema sp. UFV-L1]NMG07676.1 hypothetical protein [Brasilonema sp. UFV-L1]